MAHYAFLDDDNVVVQVISGKNEDDLVPGVESWEIYYAEVKGLRCLQTSYNTIGGIHYDALTGAPSEDQTKAIRKNYAGIGYTYDEERDAFIPPQPFPSWILNEETCLWDAPVPYPTDGERYIWDEEAGAWVVPSD